MTDSQDDDIERTQSLDRRSFIGAVGAGAAASTAGCTDFVSDALPGGDEIVEGGRPVMAMDTAPDTLNPLRTSTAYSWAIIENIYTFGVVENPETNELVPHAWEEIELNEENIDTDEPTVVAELRDDMEFNDGTPVTADDVEFTAEYIQEQQPAGTLSAAQFASLDRIEATGEHTVEYYLSQRDAGWLTEIVGTIILPEHVWEDVDDYATYQPEDTGDGIVGSGPMVLENYQPEEWYELEWRDDDEIWQTEHGWVEDEAPFTDAIRVEVFGSDEALEQAVLQNNVDYPFLSFRVDNAVDALEDDDLEVYQTDDDGWRHRSYNTRRVPLDDPAFRQLLVKLQDDRWVVEEVFQDVGATSGSYATPGPYTDWRPPEPESVEDFQGIELDDLDFPGEAGDARIDEAARDRIIDFLQNHDRAVHDYEYGPAESDAVDADVELYVNGEPLSEAHTDNDGNSGEGPLTITFDPPERTPNQARITGRQVEVLQEAGIPAEQNIIAFNELVTTVYGNENFDIFAMGWDDVGAENLHYRQMFSGAAADLEGDDDALNFNAMGYVNADDLINENRNTLELEQRKPVVREILARIYADAPTNIAWHDRVLQPTNTDYEGWVQVPGGIASQWTNLNLRLTPEAAEEVVGE